MSASEITYFILTLILMLFGLIGSVLPVIPGIPIIWAAAFLYGLLTGFEQIGFNYLFIFGLLTLLSLILDWIAGLYGAKKMGASKWGIVGAFVGMIVGLFVGALPGMIIGPFVGAVAFELIAGKASVAALKAGFGTFIGFVAGVIVKLVLAAVMIGVFVRDVLFATQ